MKEIRKTSQFKKDYKRFKNDKEFVETLMEIVKLLAEGNRMITRNMDYSAITLMGTSPEVILSKVE